MKTRFLRDDWEFNVLGIYNYRKPGPFDKYFEFIFENHEHLLGDICEAGVFQGKSLLATALLLKELGSDKMVWGFDSFHGFPEYHENDSLDKFAELYEANEISEMHYRAVKQNLEYRSITIGREINPSNISSSGDFSSSMLEVLLKKIEYLGLDNVQLVKGSFDVTMDPSYQEYPHFCGALIDCDLYSSYKAALPFVWTRLVKGGYMFIDEYYSLKFPGARIATNEFFRNRRDKPQAHKQVINDFERWFVRKLFD